MVRWIGFTTRSYLQGYAAITRGQCQPRHTILGCGQTLAVLGAVAISLLTDAADLCWVGACVPSFYLLSCHCCNLYRQFPSRVRGWSRTYTLQDLFRVPDHRDFVGLDAALAEVVNNRGRLYASDVVDAAVRLVNQKGYVLPT